MSSYYATPNPGKKIARTIARLLLPIRITSTYSTVVVFVLHLDVGGTRIGKVQQDEIVYRNEYNNQKLDSYLYSQATYNVSL